MRALPLALFVAVPCAARAADPKPRAEEVIPLALPSAEPPLLDLNQLKDT